MAEQLDLLAWRSPCSIYLFPAGRLIGRARRLVDMAMRKDEATMHRVWAITATEMDLNLADAGATAEQRASEIRAFSNLVRAELLRRTYRSSEGDAA